MKCPKCDTDNPDGNLFCDECGSKLEVLCPECSTENRPSAKFCGKCGYTLSRPATPTPKELTFEEKLEKIQKYLPKGLAEKIISQRDRIEGERKQVTVMFCDLEGFTPLVEKLGADEAYAVMDRVYELLIHSVQDYEGTVNEMTGDGIMALFGAPIALEDAPQKAVRSALAVHRQIAILNDKLKKEEKNVLPLRMRIGIHSGPVVVGTLGNDLRVEFKAVGDTVNLASRMEDLAEPGSTYVTEDLFKLTEGLFRFEALGTKEIKGKTEPINAYRVITTSSRRTRFDVNAERGLTPLVGRERELEILLDGFETVKSGRGQAISIIAEAGAGKSRLLYEFRKAIENEDVGVLEGKCLSYAGNVAYHPVIDILKANYRIEDGDNEYDIKQRVTRGLESIGVDPSDTLPYLLDIIGVKESGIEDLSLTPELRKERIIESLHRIIIKGSEQQPLILVFEDLHWVDSATEALLSEVLDSIPGSRVMLLFSYRPEYIHAWGAKSYHSQITLNRLSNRESLSMLAHILDTKEIETDVEELVLAKTEGIPFYIEEFVKSLMDLKIIEKREKFCLVKDIHHLTIPSSIQDVIMARVDVLTEEAKEVLQTGSVIEREFSYEMIKKITELPEKQLLLNLSVLKDAELIYERGIYPETAYIFKHSLTREVVYDSILSSRKKNLHDKVGQIILILFQDNIESLYEILAGHFNKSENYEAGAKYWKLAARKANKSDLNLEAIDLCRRALFCFEKLAESDWVQSEKIKTRIALSEYNLVLNYHVEAKEAIDPIIEQVYELNLSRYFPFLNTVLGTYFHYFEENYTKAAEHLEKAIQLSEENQNYPSLAGANYFMGNLIADYQCDIDKSHSYYESAFQLTELGNAKPFMAAIKSSKVLGLVPKGRIDLAEETSEEALKISIDCDKRAKGHAATAKGWALYGKGEITEAENSLLKGLDLCEKSGQISWAYLTSMRLVVLSAYSNKLEKAAKLFQKAISFGPKTRLKPSFYRQVQKILAIITTSNSGKKPELSGLFENFKIQNWFWFLPIALFFGKFLINSDYYDLAESEKWIRNTIKINKQVRFNFCLGQNHALYSEFFKRQNNLPQAREQMNKAIDIMRECGADGWVERYEKELAELT